MESLEKEWTDFEKELEKFQNAHKDYVKKLEEVESLKKSNLQQFLKHKKKLNQLKENLEKIEKKKKESITIESEEEDASKSSPAAILKSKVDENLSYMKQISDTFPRENGIYLKIILGSVCVSILNKEEKWKYKEEYEKFKFFITIISLCFSFLLIFIQTYRVLDAIFNFLLVWYYCTLTIRESILIVNGSQIKGWWLTHHFITTVCTAILLIWPDSQSYHAFRQQFIWFSFYISFVQLLQYYYQKGCLYRLRALGEKEDMDTTMEGFQTWMSKGLSFLLPFLFIGYFWELHNAYVLFNLSLSDMCHEWQVSVLSVIFFVLFAGNFVTTYKVIRKKFRDRVRNLFWLKYKYSDWKKLKGPSDRKQE